MDETNLKIKNEKLEYNYMRILIITNDKIDRIIKAKKKSEEWDLIPANETDLSPVNQLKRHLKNPEALEFSNLVNNLSLEEKKELSALFWLGKGDLDSFESAYKNANKVVGDGKLTAHYLGGKDLSKYISKSLEKLSEEGITLKN